MKASADDIYTDPIDAIKEASENYYTGVTSDLYVKGDFNEWNTSLPFHKGTNETSPIYLSMGTHEIVVNDANDFMVYEPIANQESLEIEFSNRIPKLGEKVLPSDSQQPSRLTISQPGWYIFSIKNNDKQKRTLVLQSKRDIEKKACMLNPSNNYKINVSPAFDDDSIITDAISGINYKVENGSINIKKTDNSHFILLENSSKKPISRDDIRNGTLYYIMIDRFYNGRKDNDLSYERFHDNKQEIGTFHGGDISGVIQKLDYIKSLGVTAIVLSSPLEQIHGWVGGGSKGDYPLFSYAGFYTLDYSKLDKNFGSESEFDALIKSAHSLGIKIYLSAVINHPGYATLDDMQNYSFGSIVSAKKELLPANWSDWRPRQNQTWHDMNSIIDHENGDWSAWWGKDWVRARLNGYKRAGESMTELSIAGLPDFKTESEKEVYTPSFLEKKNLNSPYKKTPKKVREHLTEWMTYWIENYGVDGFLLDAKAHIDSKTIHYFAEQSKLSYAKFQLKNENLRNEKNSGDSFFIYGEQFGVDMQTPAEINDGLDSMLNFSFQNEIQQKTENCYSNIDEIYATYSEHVQKNKNMVSYISSHDSYLYTSTHGGDISSQSLAAFSLGLLPGTIQLFYGDETMRMSGPFGSDPYQGTRSDMNWMSIGTEPYKNLLKTWQTVLNFRARHPSIGYGTHTKLSVKPYAFSRTIKSDKIKDSVVVVYIP